jgi:hypothetical protein
MEDPMNTPEDIDQQLRAAALQRALTQPAKSPSQLPRLLLAAVAGALAIGGVALIVQGTAKTSSAVQPAVTSPVDDARSVTDRRDEPTRGGNAVFGLAMVDGGYMDDVDEATRLIELSTDAIEDFDLVTAADYSTQVADIYGDLHDAVIDLPGAGSELGTLSIEAFAVCRDTYTLSAEMLVEDYADMDFDAVIESLEDCSAATEAAGEEAENSA